MTIQNIGKYAQLVILASIVKPKSLSELGMFWYNENGRFYKKKARQEISEAVKQKILIKQKSKYVTNTSMLINSAYNDLKDERFKSFLCSFWNHPFSRKTYLCCESIKSMFNNNPEAAAEAEIHTIMNMPFILHYMQEKDSELYSLFVSMQGLEKYTNTLNQKSEANLSVFQNLGEKTRWINNLNKIIKNNKHIIRKTTHGLNIIKDQTSK